MYRLCISLPLHHTLYTIFSAYGAKYLLRLSDSAVAGVEAATSGAVVIDCGALWLGMDFSAIRFN